MNIITQITAALGAVKGLVQAGKDLYAAYGHGRWIAGAKAKKQAKQATNVSVTKPAKGPKR